MKKIKITENQLNLLTENEDEMSFEEVQAVLESLAEYRQARRHIAKVAAMVYDDAGYHAGTLGGKSDYLGNGYRGDMPFTGYYFIGNPESVIAGSTRVRNGKFKFQIADFSKYKLLKLGTNSYWAVKYALKRFEDNLLRTKDFEESFSKFRENTMSYFNNVGVRKDAIENLWNSWYGALGNGQVERFETGVLKVLGFEGVDVRGTQEGSMDASPDSFSEGSVIFDLKPGTYTSLAQAFIDSRDGKLDSQVYYGLKKMIEDFIEYEEVNTITEKQLAMKKIKISESQMVLLSKVLKEDYNDKGTVQLKQDTDPNTIKKFTDDGINVSMVDEDVEQPEQQKPQQQSGEDFLKHYFAGAESISEQEGTQGGGFTLEGLKSINSFKGRVDYCNANLRKLGAGTSRIAYEYGTDHVIKLAKNKKGLAQNQVEASHSRDAHMFPILAECLDSDDYGDYVLFVVMEKAKMINESRWSELTGINWREFIAISGNVSRPDDFFDTLYDMLFDRGDDDNEFAAELQDFSMSADTSMGDMFKLSTYGEVVRDGQPRVVMIDYGINDAVLKQHYRR